MFGRTELMSLNFLNEGNKQFNEVNRYLNQHPLSFVSVRIVFNSGDTVTCMGDPDQNLRNLKRKIFQPTDKVTSHSQYRITIPQRCVKNFVFSHFTGHQPWYRLKVNWYLSLYFIVIIHNGDISTQHCYWHLLKYQDCDKNSDSVMVIYAVAVLNCITV